MGRMRFAKAHGTGNDFVVLPDPDGELDLTPATVVALCDRRRGIGADGVLRVVRSAKDPDAAAMAAEAEWFMDYRNADGSVSEMCGNGVRAFARYLALSGYADGEVAVATRAGVVHVVIGPEMITTGMPRPIVGAAGVARVGGVAYAGTAADVGNPHLVCPVDDLAALADLDLTTPPLVDAGHFPAGVNVEFVVPSAPVDGADLAVTMRVHERGSGETMSCGSGACAVAAVVLAEAGRPAGTVAVDVPGGRLLIEIDATSCRLSGPAVVVATGTVHL
jgi:diaminopimelate epimerase